MKKYIVLLVLAAGFISCEKAVVDIQETEPFVSLLKNESTYSAGHGYQTLYSNFYYKDAATVRDTLWIQLVTKAAIPSKDCKVNIYSYENTISSLLQAGSVQATEGVQFLPFNSQEMQDLLVFHAGNMYDSIPVILLRDASLKDATYRITLRLSNSDDIKAADHLADTIYSHTFVEIYVADGLSKPSNWPSFLGTYGTVKHDFIIRHTGDRWDAEFIKTIDTSQSTYYQYKFHYLLEEENAQRVAQGLSKLTESNGTLVEFYIGN